MTLSGQCYCGAITWQTEAEPAWCCYCHCASCRRNCAAPVAAFFGVPEAALRWTGATPATFRRDDVTRHFCATCGTPVGYQSTHFPGDIHLYVAGLTDASALAPAFHVNHAEALPWLRIDDALPRYPRLVSDGLDGTDGD